jgi:hypothetical protein
MHCSRCTREVIEMQEPAPTSRSYTHDRCRQETVVSDSAFTNLASPLSDIQQTYCSGCKGMFQVSEFSWSDTTEKLIDYRKRLAGHAGSIARFLCSKNAVISVLVIAIGMGAILAQLLSPIQAGLLGYVFTAIGLSVLSLIAFAAILISVITPIVHQRVCGVSDPRRLQ